MSGAPRLPLRLRALPENYYKGLNWNSASSVYSVELLKELSTVCRALDRNKNASNNPERTPKPNTKQRAPPVSCLSAVLYVSSMFTLFPNARPASRKP
jgi:hypothetical protein